jgi:hypothetical protein
MRKMNGGLTMDDEMKIEVDEQIVKSIMAMIILLEKRNLRLPVTQRKTKTQMEQILSQEIIKQVPKE